MTTQDFLDIAEVLKDKDQFAIAQRLAELYYGGIQEGIDQVKAVLA